MIALPPILSLLGFSCVALQGVLGGLEHCKHSTKLDHTNFDAQTKVPQVGTLVAFFAPWCGHCKNLLGTWDLVAQTFSTDPKCRVGHLDADQSTNRNIASRFSVSGFPTIKFIPSKPAQPAITYEENRTPDDFIQFLNKHCGTQRASGGLLLPEAGRVASLDDMIASFLGASSTDRLSLVDKATQLAAAANSTAAAYYVKVMTKLSSDESWLSKESERLKKLAAKSATMATDKFEELQIKQNILQAFSQVKEGAKAAKDEAEQVVEKVKGEL